MVNLLFNTTQKPNSFSSIHTQAKVVEVVLFEINPEYSKEEAEKALSSFNDVIKLYYGFVERITASNEDGRYIDIIYWSDIDSAKSSAIDIKKNKEATAIFSIIKPESIQMYHFDTFNRFEE
ncbi:hypothetical protein [Aquimarina sp. I32.4]|uniref:hypothetical protein n=1 Tax=Aquimarina sp. I32.4 TaxID=2053903 RepID=UPI000CDECB15|nr:hypothetical protein [Aquimarina sp. I32.4]